MKVTEIRCEYLRDPIGIDVARPTITWKLEGVKKQTAFEIVYSVNGFEQPAIHVEGFHMRHRFESPFSSRDEVTYKIRVQNEAGEWSPYCDPHRFVLGLLSPSDWSARWIYGDYPVSKKRRYPVDYFRKTFTAHNPKKATLYITALGIYEARINGRKVGEAVLAPGSTDPRKRVHYDTYEVAGYLNPGENRVEVLLSDGWYRGSIGAKGFTYVFGKNTKLLVQLEIEEEEGRTVIPSDDTWSWSNDGPIRFADLKDGEIVDFSLSPSYSGKVRVGRYEGIVNSSNNTQVKVLSRNNALAPLTSQTGHIVYPFENNVAGNVRIVATGKKGGVLHMVFGEMLDEHGDVTLRNVQCTRKGKKTPLQEVTLVLEEGVNEYEAKFWYGGFRYAMVLEAENAKIVELQQLALSSEMGATSRFECSNALINTFHENTVRSCRSNFVDIPTDCPTRERMGWTGDSQIIFETAAYLFDCHAFFRKHLEDVFDRQDKNGRLPQIAPYSAEDWFMDVMNGSVGWADVGVLVPYRMYQRYGDVEILRKYYPDMVRYAKFMIRRCGPAKGLYAIYAKPLHLSKENRRYGVNTGQSYGEWAEPSDVKAFAWTDFAMPHPEESMAYTAHILGLMVEIANLLGETEDVPLFEKYRDGVTKAYQELVTKPAHTLDTDRQCKQVRPLHFHLLTEEQEEFAKKRLLEALDHYGWRLGTGFLSTPFILYVLQTIDPDAAYKLLLNERMPGWLYMAKENTGTIWEGWEGPNAQAGIASLNHYSKGAMVEWLYASMLGIRVEGENRFRVEPVIGQGVDFAKGSYDSPYGKIAVSWKKQAEQVAFEVTVPGNTEATFLYKGEAKRLEPGTHCFTLNA